VVLEKSFKGKVYAGRRTTDDGWAVITIAHLSLSAQVS